MNAKDAKCIVCGKKAYKFFGMADPPHFNTTFILVITFIYYLSIYYINMNIIERHEGKRRGEKGITIHMLKQGSNEKSKTITVTDVTIDELYNKLIFFLKTLLEVEGNSKMKIIIEKEGD